LINPYGKYIIIVNEILRQANFFLGERGFLSHCEVFSVVRARTTGTPAKGSAARAGNAPRVFTLAALTNSLRRVGYGRRKATGA